MTRNLFLLSTLRFIVGWFLSHAYMCSTVAPGQALLSALLHAQLKTFEAIDAHTTMKIRYLLVLSQQHFANCISILVVACSTGRHPQHSISEQFMTTYRHQLP